jgi:hypothetical protein
VISNAYLNNWSFAPIIQISIIFHLKSADRASSS